MTMREKLRRIAVEGWATFAKILKEDVGSAP